MKKSVILFAALLAIVALPGCKSKSKMAAEKAKTCAGYIMNSDYDQFVNHITYDKNLTSAQLEQQKASDAAILKRRVHPMVAEKGGIKEVNVVSTNLAEENPQVANVVFTNLYNNGDIEDVEYLMVLDENVWKVKVSNDRTVWKTRTDDGERVSFKLIDEPHKDVFKEHIDGEREFIKEKDKRNVEVEKIKEDGKREVTRTPK